MVQLRSTPLRHTVQFLLTEEFISIPIWDYQTILTHLPNDKIQAIKSLRSSPSNCTNEDPVLTLRDCKLVVDQIMDHNVFIGCGQVLVPIKV